VTAVLSCPTTGPLFIDCAGRSIFVQRFLAASQVAFQGTVLHLAAFAEEMNKSRAMVAAQAREMARIGYDVLVPDYFGCGDSGGEFSEASWTVWREDMRTCLTQLRRDPAVPVVLWGLRLGALMAIQLSSMLATPPSRLVLWNPVLNGGLQMTQFLRLRLANSMMHGAAKEKAADLQAMLEEQGLLEVAGYELPKALFQQVTALKAAEMTPPAPCDLFWREVSPSAAALPLPAKDLITQWQPHAGVNIDAAVIEGPPFWSTQEIAHSQQLITATTDHLRASASGDAASISEA